MRAALVCFVVLGACDPIWAVNARVRDTRNQPIEDATVAVSCPDGTGYAGADVAVRSDKLGAARLGGLGTMFPPGCDVFIAKPGFRTQRIRYADICPRGANHCDRVVSYDLVLEHAAPPDRQPVDDQQ